MCDQRLEHDHRSGRAEFERAYQQALDEAWETLDLTRVLNLRGCYDLEVERDRRGPILDEIRPVKTA